MKISHLLLSLLAFISFSETSAQQFLVDVRGELKPDFDYSMAERYGLDRNKDDSIDLPNSFEYSQNILPDSKCNCTNNNCLTGEPRFQIQLDASKSKIKTLIKEPRTISQEEIKKSASDFKNSRNPDGSYNIDVSNNNPQPIPESRLTTTYNWTITDINDQSKVYAVTGPAPSVCLAESSYLVSLGITQEFGGQRFNAKKARVLDVEDIFIVLLGDSYAAGEGAPEKLNHAANRLYHLKNSSTLANIQKAEKVNRDAAIKLAEQALIAITPINYDVYTLEPARWADTGIIYKTKKVTERIDIKEGHKVQKWGDISPAVMETHADIPDWVSIGSTPKLKMMEENYRSHRSSFTHASQLALEIENSDKRTSVTFINLAQSGATIRQGGLAGYSGVSLEAASKSFKKNVARQDYLMEPQLHQLKNLVGNRTIDALIIGFGGNDAGFSQVIGGLLANDERIRSVINQNNPLVKYRDELLEATITGDWNRVSALLQGIGFISGEATSGLHRLVDDYHSLNDTLISMEVDLQKAGFTKRPRFYRKYMLGYPFFGSIQKNNKLSYCSFGLENVDENWLKKLFIEEYSQIVPAEFEWADNQIYKLLVSTMKAAAIELDWTFVDLEPISRRHGVCGDKIVNRPRDYQPSHPIDSNIALQEGLSWYRSSREGAMLQAGDGKSNKGMIHPNEYGYFYAKEQLRKTIALPVNIPRMLMLNKNELMTNPIVVNKNERERIFGTLHWHRSVDLYRFSLDKGKSLQVQIKSSNQHGLRLRLFNSNGEDIFNKQKFSEQKSTQALAIKPDQRMHLNGEKLIINQVESIADSIFKINLITNDLIIKTTPLTSINYTAEKNEYLYLGVSFEGNYQYDPSSGAGDTFINGNDINESYTIDIFKNNH